jgi:iron complex outermembrane receptor protein
MIYRSIFILLALLLVSVPLLAQPATDEVPDSARTYRLGEITVTGDTIPQVQPTTVQRLSYPQITRTDALTAAGIVHALPAARIQTNSRGESLLYLRGAAERQVSVFFDGAFLNVPWDNRVDLSLVPSGAIGGMTVSKGIASTLYGVNTIGGALNIVSLDQRTPGYSTEIQSQVGTNEVLGGSLVHMGRTGDFNYIGELSYNTRGGIPLPKDANLAFNQSDANVRTNTDSRSMSLYLRGENHFAERAEIGLAVHYIDAEKGVAPEGNVEDPRFWRYPLWRNLTISLNSEADFGENRDWSFRGAVWHTRFQQDIAQFDDVSYAIASAQEEDRDNSFGTRLVLRRQIGTGALNLALNGLVATHDQRDLRFDTTGALIPFRDASGNIIDYPTASYQQQLYSIGAEFDQRWSELGITLGASFDGMQTPKTGDKPSQEPFGDYSLLGGATYDLSPTTVLRGSAGRKTRFPTMRELYGEALRRFLINPDLKPEESWIGELGGVMRGEWGSVELVGFGQVTSNTIDQRTLDTLGGTRRQRINLEGSRTLGVELVGQLRQFRPLRLDAHLTVMNPRGRATSSTGADSTFFLSEKPEMLGTLTAEYEFDFGLLPMIEIVQTGVAYSPNDDNEFVQLEPSTVINVRLAYRFSLFGENTLAQAYVRANNVTDALVLPQLGLPGAGREIVGGIKISL